MGVTRRYSQSIVGAALAVILTFLLVTGCADDPLLSPEGIEDTDTGGSYGKLEYPSQTGPVDTGMRDSTRSQNLSTRNPEQF